MKTQGITLMTSTVSEVKITRKTTKASDETFGNFISQNAANIGNRQNSTGTEAAVQKPEKDPTSSNITNSKKSEDGSSPNTTQSKDAKTENVTKPIDETPKDVRDVKTGRKEETGRVEGSDVPAEDEIDVAKLEEEIMAILQDVLNMLPQDIQDIFEGMGMTPTDLITGLKSGEIESFSITTVQTFVMEVHGIRDASAFLTNDVLNSEMNEIFDRMKNLLSELMRMGVQDIEKLDAGVWESFTMNLVQAKAELATSEPVIQNENEGVPVIETEGDSGEDTPNMSVIIENQTSDQAGSNTGENAGQGTGLGADDVRDAAADLEAMSKNTQVTTIQEFAQTLTEALEPEASQVQDTQRMMTEMVEQVVRQVRVRMMPESTNMELQLHPASLGRVNVQINATGQEATARLIVENQAAKEALESGMIRLQEAFEEKGIKVNAVEVTISNFDLTAKQDSSGDDASQNENNGRQRNGNSTTSDTVATTGIGEDNLTEASRRDINSTVDYTA